MEDPWPTLLKAAAVAVALIAASSFFVLFREALKHARKPRLQKEADDFDKQQGERRNGKKRRAGKYRRLWEAAENPNKYFAVAEIWICILRTLAVVIFGFNAGRYIESQGQHSTFAVFLAVAACAAFLACIILVPGNLIPGIIARRAPEKIAAAALFPFNVFALPLRPFFVLGQKAASKLRLAFPSRSGMTEDEFRIALEEGEKSGIMESKERTMVEGVFYLGDHPLRAFMTHRSEIQWLDINAPLAEIREKVLLSRSQRCFPVAEGAPDAIVGAVYAEDIFIDLASEAPSGLRGVMKKAVFVPETMPAIKAFESFKKGEDNFLFVMDEYGGFAGAVSAHNLMEQIVGSLTASAKEKKPAVQREDGSWLADGSINIDEAAQLFSLPGLASPADDYHTLAGFVLFLAGELPCAGDSFTYHGYRFTVTEMGNNRIDRIMVEKEERS